MSIEPFKEWQFHLLLFVLIVLLGTIGWVITASAHIVEQRRVGM